MAARAHHGCPICGRDAPPRGQPSKNSSFPFCSPACKLIDLGRWLDGSYRVPGTESASPLDALDHDGARFDRGRDDE